MNGSDHETPPAGPETWGFSCIAIALPVIARKNEAANLVVGEMNLHAIQSSLHRILPIEHVGKQVPPPLEYISHSGENG